MKEEYSMCFKCATLFILLYIWPSTDIVHYWLWFFLPCLVESKVQSVESTWTEDILLCLHRFATSLPPSAPQWKSPSLHSERSPPSHSEAATSEHSPSTSSPPTRATCLHRCVTGSNPLGPSFFNEMYTSELCWPCQEYIMLPLWWYLYYMWLCFIVLYNNKTGSIKVQKCLNKLALYKYKLYKKPTTQTSTFKILSFEHIESPHIAILM